MHKPLDLRKHLLHVANLPALDYAMPEYTPETDTPLGMAIAKGKLYAPMSYTLWQVLSVDSGWPPIQFNWRAVSQFHPRRTLAVIHSGGTPEAMMQMDERYLLRDVEQRRGPLVYVSFLEVAPWNKTDSARRRYRGLGQLLLRFAFERSKALGQEAAIGLHSLPTAEPFYERLGFKRLDCPNEYHEPYFELSETAAQRVGWMRAR